MPANLVQSDVKHKCKAGQHCNLSVWTRAYIGVKVNVHCMCGLTVFAADMMAMSERILTGAVKVSERRATRQIIPKEVTNAVLVLAMRANTEVKIRSGLCKRV